MSLQNLESESRYPFYRLPVIVPAGANVGQNDEQQTARVEVPAWSVLALFGIFLLLPDRLAPSIAALRSGKTPRRRNPDTKIAPRFLRDLTGLPRKVRGNRLFYMFQKYDSPEPVSISRARARKMIASEERGIVQEGYLYPVFAKTADAARKMIKSGDVPHYDAMRGLAGLSGRTANCGVWLPAWSEKEGGEVWRCGKYGPVPTRSGSECAPGPQNAVRTCVETQKVPYYTGIMVKRCKRYEPVCGARPVLEKTMPMPNDPLQRGSKNKRNTVRSIATEMAKDANIAETHPFIKEIMERGGIRSYRKGAQKEEYREVPLFLKRKTGLPLDEMASELGMDERALLSQITKLYPKGKKKKQRFIWKDFEGQAERMVERGGFGSLGDLWSEYRSGPEQNELFKAKRTLTLKIDDPATAQDTLDSCLQRRGWKISRVRQLQASIAEKMTPDMFTGKQKPLNGSEAQLQEQIQDCLTFMKKSTTKRGQLELFGAGLWMQNLDMKKGAFKAQAKRARMSTDKFASHVLRHPERFHKKTAKRARLAKTFKKARAGH